MVKISQKIMKAKQRSRLTSHVPPAGVDPNLSKDNVLLPHVYIQATTGKKSPRSTYISQEQLYFFEQL
jgi:hypothetical protein